MRFNTKRAGFIKSAVGLSCIVPLIIVSLYREAFMEKPVAMVIILIPFFFFVWVYVDTYYIIKDNILYYKSAFIKGEITVTRIQKIIKGKTAWSGLRPATALNGLTIQYDKYDELYISPEDDVLFVQKLKEINARIIVE